MSVDVSRLNLDDFPLFRQIEPDVVQAFLRMGYTFNYEAGTPLVVSDDQGQTFFMILSGMAKLVLPSAQQEEVNVTLFHIGDFFGEMAMLEEQAIRTANIIAVTDVEVLVMQKPDFLAILRRHPDIALNLTRVLGQRLRAMNQRMMTVHLPETNKVASTFVTMYHKGRRLAESDTVLLPPLTLKEWALFCYTSPDNFMEQIEIMRQNNILEWQNQRIAIKNYQALREYAENPLTSDGRVGGTA